MCIGGDEPTVDRVSLVLSILVPDVRRDGFHLDMVVLPDVPEWVQHSHFPVQVPTRIIVFDIDHLAPRLVEYIRAVNLHHVHAVMKVGRTPIVLVRLHTPPDGIERKWPVIHAMVGDQVWIAGCQVQVVRDPAVSRSPRPGTIAPGHCLDQIGLYRHPGHAPAGTALVQSPG